MAPKTRTEQQTDRKTEMRISDIVVRCRRAASVATSVERHHTNVLILFTMKLKCVDRMQMQMLVRVD